VKGVPNGQKGVLDHIDLDRAKPYFEPQILRGGRVSGHSGNPRRTLVPAVVSPIGYIVKTI